ncbi:MAG TPA: DUF1801 domain-containing protein [bacterium]|nr:DUF1801 domain-containing protein [bacterium]
MARSTATTVEQYLDGLPLDRRVAIEAVRQVVLDNLGPGFEEGIQYGMIGYFVPHSVYPNGYHCDPRQPLPYLSLAAQKNHFAIYLMGLYMDPDGAAWFERAWRATGKKLDMGRACVRFKKLEDVPLDVVAEAIRRMPAKRYIATYEAAFAGRGPARSVGKKKAAAKKAAKK